MSWSRAKTILIIFFVALNAVLLANILYTDNKASVISADVISSTVQVLEKNNIYINAGIIPKKAPSVKSDEVTNVIDEYRAFAEKMLGADGVGDMGNNVFDSTGGTVEFSADSFVCIPKNPWYSELTQNVNEKNAAKTAVNILKKSGFDMSSSEAVAENRGNGEFLVKFTKTLRKRPIFDSALFVLMSGEGVKKIYGSWFEYDGLVSGKDIPTKNVTGVLIDFINSPLRPQGEVRIEDLEFGCAVNENTQYHKTVMPVPVWRITLNNGQSVYMDARKVQ
jgi:hypothetical protein